MCYQACARFTMIRVEFQALCLEFFGHNAVDVESVTGL